MTDCAFEMFSEDDRHEKDVKMAALTFDEFSEQLKLVLRNLYDYAYLESCPLCSQLTLDGAADGSGRAERCRRAILQAIEALCPPDRVAINSREWRGYNILCARFVEQMSPEEAIKEFALSPRQFYRDQRKAIESLAHLLWRQCAPAGDSRMADRDSEGTPTTSDPLLREIEQLAPQVNVLQVGDLLAGVVRAVEVLAQDHGVTLACTVESDLPPIHANRTLARQALIQLLSRCAAQRAVRRVYIKACRDHNVIAFQVDADATSSVAADLATLLERDAIQPLVSQAGGAWRGVQVCKDGLQVELAFPTHPSYVLLTIEDNPGAVQLLQRYVAQHGYRVVAISSGDEALAVVRELTPDCILLDIMLPHQDGWEVLAQLKDDAATCHVPVVVCSVLDAQELATAMGADAYLKKPFSQLRLIEILADLRERR